LARGNADQTESKDPYLVRIDSATTRHSAKKDSQSASSVRMRTKISAIKWKSDRRS